MNLTESWQRLTLIIELDRNWNWQTFWNPKTLNLHPGPPNLHARCFFLVEERRDRASKPGQVSQPVQACEPGLGDLSKLTAPACFFVVKVMFIGAMNFGQIQKLGLVSVKNFQSCLITTFGHLHLVKLTSYKK